MKTLAMILLLATTGRGQDTIPDAIVTEWPIDNMSRNPYDDPALDISTQYVGEPDPVFKKPMTWPDFIAKWDEYKDSCWADSTGAAPPGTVRVFGTPCWVELEWPGETTWDEMRKNCKRPDHSHYTAVHRTPDFPGFMEFIKRRKQ